MLLMELLTRNVVVYITNENECITNEFHVALDSFVAMNFVMSV